MITAIERLVVRRPFLRNVAVMLTGAVLGQGASVLLSPVLTRIYSPAEFGYLSVYTAALWILMVLASLHYEMALPIANSEAEAANVLALCGLTLGATTSVIGAIAWWMPASWLTLLWVGPLAAWRPLVPLGFALMGAYSVLVYLATREGAFNELARTRISQGLSGPLSQIGLGLAGAGAPGLAIGFILGQSSGTILLFSRLVLRRLAWLRAISWQGIRAVAWRYRRFPLFSSWGAVCDAAGSGVILYLLFGTYYSSEIAGFIFLSERIVARPLLLVSSSVLQVYVGEAGAAVKDNPARLRRRFRQVVSRQALLVGGWIAIVNLLAAWAFPLLFGSRWAEAVFYLRALSLSYMALSVLHAVSQTLQILERQALAAAWQFSRLAAVVLTVVLAWHMGSPALHALWAYSAVQALACLIMLALMAVSIKRAQ